MRTRNEPGRGRSVPPIESPILGGGVWGGVKE